MAKLIPSPKFHVEKSDGTPASGWKVNTYEPGTSTRKSTYTTSAESTANANPVVLDSRGEANIWWSGSYKVVVTDENDVVIYTVDNSVGAPGGLRGGLVGGAARGLLE